MDMRTALQLAAYVVIVPGFLAAALSFVAAAPGYLVAWCTEHWWLLLLAGITLHYLIRRSLWLWFRNA